MYSWQFPKNFPLPTYGGHFEFSNFCQKWKNTNLPISLTVRDRAISSKFSTHRVSKQCTLGNFQKIFLFPKMAAIFNFCQKWQKHKFASISLTVRDRAILSKFSIHRVSKQCTLGNFQKIFLFPKMAKHKFASISLTVQDGAISSKFSTQSLQKGMKLK